MPPGRSAAELEEDEAVMEQLLGQAQREANQELRAHLFSSQQLGRLPNFRAELLVKHQKLQHQLGSALRAQMEETRLGLDLLRDANAAVRAVQDRFNDVSQTCSSVQQLLNTYGQVAGIHVAKGNLERTQRLLADVRRLPETVDNLVDTLLNDETAIKDVYLQYRRFIRLRDLSLEQLSGFAEDFRSTIRQSFQSLDEVGQEILLSVKDNMKLTLELAEDSPLSLIRTLEVLEMEDRAQQKVLVLPKAALKYTLNSQPGEALMSYFKSLMAGDIAVKFQMPQMDPAPSEEQKDGSAEAGQPADTSAADANPNAKKSGPGRPGLAAVEDAPSDTGDDDDNSDDDEGDEGSDDDDDDGEDSEDERIRARELRIQKQQRTQMLLDYLKELKVRFQEELPLIAARVVPLFPPRWNIQRFYVREYYRMADIALQQHLTDPRSMSYREILESVRWMQWYRWQRLNSELPDVDDLMDNIRVLMITYLDVQRDGFTNKIQKIFDIQKREEPQRNSARSSQLSLNGRNDLFTFINLQLRLVEEFEMHSEAAYFMGAMLADVVDSYTEMLLGFLSDFLIDQTGEPIVASSGALVFGQEERLEKGEPWLIALMNDAKLSADHVEGMIEKLLDPIAATERDQAQQYAEDGSALVGDPLRESAVQRVRAGIHAMNQELSAAMEERLWASQALLFDLVEAVQGLLVMRTAQTVRLNMSRSMFREQWVEKPGVLEMDVLLPLDQSIGDLSEGIHDSLSPFISQRFVPPILRPLVANVTSLYMGHLWRVQPKYSQAMVRRVKEDWATMQRLFEDWPITRPDGFVANFLRYFELLIQFLESSPDYFEAFFPQLIQRFPGLQSRLAFQKVLLLRGDINKPEKDELLALFDKALSSDRSMEGRDYERLIAAQPNNNLPVNPWVDQPLERLESDPHPKSRSYNYLQPVLRKLAQGGAAKRGADGSVAAGNIFKFVDRLRASIGRGGAGDSGSSGVSAAPGSSGAKVDPRRNVLVAATQPTKPRRQPKMAKDDAPSLLLSEFL